MKYVKKATRPLALGIAAALLTATAGAAVYDLTGDGIMNVSDVKLLQSELIRREAQTPAADIDADGCINAFDLTLLKRSILTAAETDGEEKTTAYPATADYAKVVGRTCRYDDITWLVQSGSAAEFIVTGTNASLTLIGDGYIQSEEKYRPRYAVYLDDTLVTDALLSESSLEVPLFSGDTKRTATVKVIHLSEANNGAVGIKDLTVTSTVATPVRPTPKKDLQIEFIGDSITCAYGVEAKDQYEGFSTGTENFMKSYAYLTAKQLNADYSAVSYSGYGIISGYTSGAKNTDSLIPDCYHLTGKPSNYAVPWDFSANPNDVVVINLGTNDNSYIGTDIEGRGPEFTEGYTKFLSDVREKNPDAYIICTMGTMGGEALYPLIAQAVENHKADTGDTRIRSYQSATQQMTNGLGADWHPSELTQQLSAYVLADEICQALGLPSDRIGLDAAADGSYDTTANEAVGASASTYLGYDKSYWVNVVEGGDAPSDIKAFVGHISLLPGEYRLELSCTTTGTLAIPYAVQHKNNPDKSYCSGTIQGPVEKKAVSETFSVTEADDDCEIAFLLGGEDYFSATLSGITLYKLS